MHSLYLYKVWTEKCRAENLHAVSVQGEKYMSMMETKINNLPAHVFQNSCRNKVLLAS